MRGVNDLPHIAITTVPVPANQGTHLQPYVHDGANKLVPKKKTIQVFGPGGGSFQNRHAYQAIDLDPRFAVQIVGYTFHSGAPYDRYPDGTPGQNHHTFAQSVIDGSFHEYLSPHIQPGMPFMRLPFSTPLLECSALFFGSRGGQSILPYMWHKLGDALPPVVVVNAGPTMAGVTYREFWPQSAVVFLLVCGNDYFSGGIPKQQYLENTLAGVPSYSATTAVLFVRELSHMPDSELMLKVYPEMVKSVIDWKEQGKPNIDRFKKLAHTIPSHVVNQKLAPGVSRYTGEVRWKHGTDTWNILSFQ